MSHLILKARLRNILQTANKLQKEINPNCEYVYRLEALQPVECKATPEEVFK